MKNLLITGALVLFTLTAGAQEDYFGDSDGYYESEERGNNGNHDHGEAEPTAPINDVINVAMVLVAGLGLAYYTITNRKNGRV